VIFEHLHDCTQVLRFLGLYIEVQGDDGPAAIVSFFQSVLDYGPNAIKEIGRQSRLFAGEGPAMRDDRP
jgi:hypothetical protein